MHFETLSGRFWETFGTDWQENCRRWQRAPQNPILPPQGESWKRRWTANPDFLHRPDDGALLVYYRGNGVLPGEPEQNHDRIAVAIVTDIQSDQPVFTDRNNGLPIVDVGAPGTFDCHDVLDPATVRFQGKVFLYYSAIGAGEDSVGLAISTDGEQGEQFEKIGKVLTGRAPEVVIHEGRLMMLCQRWLNGEGGEGQYVFYLLTSEDGHNFTMVQEEPVLTGTAGEWDAHSIATGRLSVGEDGWYYLLYGGSAYRTDEPEHFGLARSRDLIHWEKHPGNPVFGAGSRGEADGGAIWFPALIETETRLVLLYEGSVGTYRWSLQSSICLASLSK